jgi:secreted trypsin-like serine protease
LDVERIFSHEDYNSFTLTNDIALIKVTAPIAFNENIQPICAPNPADQYQYRFTICSGWGTLSSGGACCPQTLQYVSMNITTNAFCDAEYASDPITADMICATDNTGSQDRDSCQGDSGGPLAVRRPTGAWEVVGIVSWGIGCASGYPGVYARVGYHNDWVLNIINNN